MILKLDHAAIIVMVGCNYIPIGVLCLTNTGIMMLSCMWLGVFIALYRIFILHNTTWWEPILIGATSLISINEMYEIMSAYSFWLTMISYISSILGGLIFTYQYPDPYSDVWGFHENMHLLTSISSILVYIVNYSIVSQCS
jgi:hemolysin III